jgi:hypothetical protein
MAQSDNVPTRSIEIRLALIFFMLLVPGLYLEAAPVKLSQPKAAARSLEARLSLPGGYYDRDIQIQITCSHPDADLIYTLDGSVPTVDRGTTYTRPIQLSPSIPSVVVIRARAVGPGAVLGPITGDSYLMGIPSTLPLISLIVTPDDLWSKGSGIYANPREKGREWERPVDIVYVDRDRSTGFHAPAGIRIHGGWTRRYDKKSFRLYFRQEYGMNRLEYPLYDHGDVQTYKRLVLHNGGNDSPSPPTNWSLLRNQLTTDLAHQTHAHTPRSQPVLVYLNGEPWGIYSMREYIDRWFLADHFGADAVDLLDSPAHIQVATISEGDREHWDHLMAFVGTHDLVDPANYAYLQSQVDLDNLIDYALIQIYTGNADWPEHNVNQLRARRPGGKWQWITWDNDYSFGLYLAPEVGYEGDLVELNVIEKILNMTSSETGGYDSLLLRKLIENPDFRVRLQRRLADLLNTTFAADNVVSRIDALANDLAPNIGYEINLWGGSVNWEASVQEMRRYAQQRTEVVRQHAIDAFGIPGRTTLTIHLPSAEAGSIAINDTWIPEYPWTGTYFQDTLLQITAVPAPGHQFATWGEGHLGSSPTITLSPSAPVTLKPHFSKLAPKTFQPGDVVFSECHVDDREVQGDWFELRIARRGGADIRGWRVTDNDTLTASDEGSLVLSGHPALARLPRGTTVRIIATQTDLNDQRFSQDDLDAWDGLLVLYVGNGNVDVRTDPGFNLSPVDSLVLLAPGPTEAFDDDQGIDLLIGSDAVSPASFGILADKARARLPCSAPSD